MCHCLDVAGDADLACLELSHIMEDMSSEDAYMIMDIAGLEESIASTAPLLREVVDRYLICANTSEGVYLRLGVVSLLISDCLHEVGTLLCSPLRQSGEVYRRKAGNASEILEKASRSSELRELFELCNQFLETVSFEITRSVLCFLGVTASAYCWRNIFGHLKLTLNLQETLILISWNL